MSMLQTTRRALFGGRLRPFSFDASKVTFTPAMAKRLGIGPFDAAPIIQGDWEGDTAQVGDLLSYPRDLQVSGNFYQRIDTVQGSVVFWVRPEWDGGDGVDRFFWYPTGNLYIRHEAAGTLRLQCQSQNVTVDCSGWTAGTTYCVVASWDVKNTIDGTNYLRLSVADAHTYGGSTQPAEFEADSPILLGSYVGATRVADALIGGFHVYRRVLWDGVYGTCMTYDDSGPVDEIAAITAGADPCVVTRGPWDVVFGLPTDCAVGALATGTGEAWSMPHSSVVLEHSWMEDGFYGGGPWAVALNGTTGEVNHGSDANLDNLPDAEMTVEAWIRVPSGETGAVFSKWASGIGWMLGVQSGIGLAAQIECATSLAISISGADELANDNKWHHVAMYFNDAGDRKIYLAADGKWVPSYSTQIAGVGAIVPDAALDLMFGTNPGGSNYLEGAFGWYRISNNDRYSHGTDFVPARTPPASDGNTILLCHVDEGTGVTLDNEQGDPNRDGTIANGTWERQWDQEGTPVIPYSVEFDGSATSVNCGSDAGLDDLADAAMTVELWMCPDVPPGGVNDWLEKGNHAAGWYLMFPSINGAIWANVYCATTNALAQSGNHVLRPYNQWHHVAFTWDDAGDRKVRLYVDGILIDTSDAGVGAVVTDAATNLYIGSRNGTTNYADASVGWARLSNTVRYSDTFVPPSRLNPPASDGNTIAQYNFREGAGVTLDNIEGTAARDGTITSGTWLITPDLEIDAPGQRIYQRGYTIGVDAANEGIEQAKNSLTAGENYVVRAAVNYERDRRAQPAIVGYDVTNGAAIVTFRLPQLYGVHDGGNNQAALSDASAPYWPASLIGGAVYNITDGSSATITATGTSITAALGGGTDNDWDNGDVYMIVPPDENSWVFADPFCFELPTIARNGAAADCVECTWRVINLNSEGVFYTHQLEVYENLVDNPSLETGAGNPFIPDGWANSGLGAGDTETEAVILHSGVASLEWNVGAASEGISVNPVAAVGKFLAAGFWSYGDTTAKDIDIVGMAGHVNLQTEADAVPIATRTIDGTNAASWGHSGGIFRVRNANPQILLWAASLAIGDRFTDDIYAFILDDVSVTVTPASLANCTEATGLRIVGRSACPQPIVNLTRGAGIIRWDWTPRHSAAIFGSFRDAFSLQVMQAWNNGTNYFQLVANANNSLRLDTMVAGVNTSAAWNCTGLIVAGTTYAMEARYAGGKAILRVNGVMRITLSPGAGINFGANIPNTMYWGASLGGARQMDATFDKP